MTAVTPQRVPANAQRVAAVVCILLSPAVSRGVEIPVSLPNGVAFNLPRELTKLPAPPEGIIASWRNAETTLEVDVITIPQSQSDLLAQQRELYNWPSVGRSMANGFGRGRIRTFSEAYGVPCTYEGTPIAVDIQRWAMEFLVDTTCPVTPEPVATRSCVVHILTNTGSVMLRVDSHAAAYAQATSVCTTIWGTLRVAEEHRLAPGQAGAVAQEPGRQLASTSGGPGIRFRDYGTIRTAWLLGEWAGAMVSALALGALLTWLLMLVRVEPVPALVLAQLAVSTLAIWGAEHDGVWEIDWAGRLLVSALAIAILYIWAKRWWKRRYSEGGATLHSGT